MRFWLYRKQVNSMPHKDIVKWGLPFYSWQCLTIVLKNQRQMNLVIEDEDQMAFVIRFLVLRLRSVDGLRNSLNMHILAKMKSDHK